jgi:hypothetical protein
MPQFEQGDSVKRLRVRLTYANVMSTIAVFLLLGGATAFATAKLGKNSVGTKQLKNNAVTTAKLKGKAVTTAKLKNGAVTGAKVNLGSLGKVPSAANADNANNANATNGMHLAKIDFVGNNNTPKTLIFSLNGLNLFAECDGIGELNFTATTSVTNSEIYESGNFTNTFDGGFNDEFDPGDLEEVGKEIGDGTQNEIQGQLVYSTPAGGIVTAQFNLNDGGGAYGNTRACDVIGTAEAS